MRARLARVVRSLLRHGQLALLAAALVALLAGLLAAGVYRRADEQSLRQLINTLAQRQAVQFDAETMLGQAMGIAALLGVNEPLLKALAQRRPESDAPEARARLEPVLRSLAADAVYVTDSEGRLVAQVSRGVQPLRQPQQRHWWRQAMAGVETVYPEVDAETRRRSLLLAAPLYAGAQRSGPVTGVVAIRLPAEDLDARLSRSGEHALLVSPQGVVFASSDERWVFRLTHRLDAAELAGLRELQQFGPDFAPEVAPQLLPFDLDRDAFELLGIRYLRARASLQWHDPSGRWQLMLLAAPHGQAPALAGLPVGLGVALLVFVLQLMLLRLLQGNAARRIALAHSEDSSRELQRLARLKARQSELTLQLQQARELPALAATLFGELARFLPLHQASLYFVDSDAEGPLLRLAGAYATDSAPAELAFGEGLLGQCALSRERIALSDVPAGFWRISTGLGAAQPRALLLLPLLRSERLLGVLEVASLTADPEPVDALLKGLLPVLATNLDVLLAERRLARLLGEARADAELSVSRLRAWLDGAPVALLLLDAEGRVLLSNRAAQTVFGYDAAGLAALRITALLPQGLPVAGDWLSGVAGRSKDGRALVLTLARSTLDLPGMTGAGSCLVLRVE